ncbi:uncharacterized protein LOC109713452 isoform X2 [Ananas comosus]|uniref:Uncharacterized protein LOC109713452 isoform X2 n=1 Tax=Ananas comosus TaxID=4615 RepID=A0A6P5FC10_ANACO|nr:uncharacterized protein LOC109713452 isoform X2 [Ananas comosus]
MPPPKNLPGFYFDPEKNRYFPVKGPIAGSKRPLSSSSSSSDPSSSSRDAPDQKNEVQLTRWKKRIKGSELLLSREIHGGLIFSNKTRCSFRQEYQKVQASRPMVWNYQSTTNVADAAIEQLDGIVQTPSGSRETKLLTTGNMMGAISLFGIGNVLAGIGNVLVDFCYGDEAFIRPIWSPSRNQKAIYDSAIWSTWCTSYPSFTSNISCIRKLGYQFSNSVNASSSYQHALVTTLGSGESGGSLNVLNLSEPLDFRIRACPVETRTSEIACFDRTIWAADCYAYGPQAAVGTNVGSALVNLETAAVSWLNRSKSDVLSLRYVPSGNVVLCGHRNGAIISVDIRQKQSELSAEPSARRPNPHRTAPLLRNDRRSVKRRVQMNGKLNSSSVVYMPSAVCSLVSLQSDEQYFLGSSMDGSIKLFDRRLLQRGAVQSYEGHVNSHTHLQLAVNPSETLLLSGGEDCVVRIWSVKTSELIFAENVANSIFTRVCWPESGEGSCKPEQSELHEDRPFELSHSWGAWLGSRKGLFYMHGT